MQSTSANARRSLALLADWTALRGVMHIVSFVKRPRAALLVLQSIFLLNPFLFQSFSLCCVSDQQRFVRPPLSQTPAG